ncbi:metal ABC transporter ATP-binding protein [Coprobacter secundus]|mgnify:FL=1|uniref:Zinc ABC transporter ATP-binding protein n=1 Tax=Coprobacter secundus subsp. similis TaxID=2751153 RepID=A0A7G1HZI0_9BACT|nr:metal ABC transporter ATP-binding protein [Coprobacter secundus]BCI64252.1 zinc ABC transporter ATP-binding protein [Coprobacter secundus subsp. similis]
MPLLRNKIIEVADVSLRYERLPVLTDIDLTVFKDDFLVITGPNGGGKTSLLRIILGLQLPSRGAVHFYREGQLAHNLNIGYLPQKNVIDSRFPITVSEVVFSGLSGSKKIFSRFTEKEQEQVEKMLLLMGLAELRDRPIGQLSGGQLQRTLLGRALVSDPEILILDEPSSYVDKAFETRMYDLLGEVAKKATILLVSHELSRVTEIANRVVRINKTLEEIR